MRLVPSALLAVLLLLSPLSSGCSAGGRDAQDIAADFEGTISSATVERLMRDVDLSRAPLTVSVTGAESQQFDSDAQSSLESLLRSTLDEMNGDRVRVTQRVVDDTSPTTQQLTLTLEVDHGGQTRYVPLTLDLMRDGRRVLVTRVRVQR